MRAADIAGVRQGTWSDWEKGTKTPRSQQLLTIEVMTEGEVPVSCWSELTPDDVSRIEEAVRSSAKPDDAA